MTMRQDPGWTTQEYFDRFRALVRVVEHLNGHLGYSEAEIARRVKTLFKTEDAAQADVQEEYLGKLLLLNADRQRFGKLLTELANSRH